MNVREREGAARIFVVDDDHTLRQALERLLRSVGYVVETFASAEEFIASGRADAQGALITDVRMPGMSGPALHGKLVREGSRLRTFLISAVEDDKVRGTVMAAGACGWFTKPLDGETLVAALVAEGCFPAGAAAFDNSSANSPD